MDDTSGWPRNPHGIFVDHNDFVWIGTYMHHRVMKFTRDGKLVMTIGQYDKNAGSNDTTLLGGPAGIWVDPKTNEVYIADGYRNRRVIVFDGATGKYLRHWGAYGEKPDDTERFDPKTMVERRAAEAVLDRARPDRIEGRQDLRRRPPRQSHPGVRPRRASSSPRRSIAPATLASGSAFVIVLSPDRAGAVAVSRRRHEPQGVDPAARRTSRSSASSVAAGARSGRCCGRTG